MAREFTLGRNERLKSRKQIDYLFAEGQRFSVSPFRVIYAMSDTPGHSALQAGFAVSTKNFKKAVDRNRVKRVIKEAYRVQKNKLRDTLTGSGKSMIIFLVYTARELPADDTHAGKIALILERLSGFAAAPKH